MEEDRLSQKKNFKFFIEPNAVRDVEQQWVVENFTNNLTCNKIIYRKNHFENSYYGFINFRKKLLPMKVKLELMIFFKIDTTLEISYSFIQVQAIENQLFDWCLKESINSSNGYICHWRKFDDVVRTFFTISKAVEEDSDPQTSTSLLLPAVSSVSSSPPSCSTADVDAAANDVGTATANDVGTATVCSAVISSSLVFMNQKELKAMQYYRMLEDDLHKYSFRVNVTESIIIYTTATYENLFKKINSLKVPSIFIPAINATTDPFVRGRRDLKRENLYVAFPEGRLKEEFGITHSCMPNSVLEFEIEGDKVCIPFLFFIPKIY
jgi:hypothetical protein